MSSGQKDLQREIELDEKTLNDLESSEADDSVAELFKETLISLKKRAMNQKMAKRAQHIGRKKR